jgi:branched-chain amino acid transport system permease protein
MTEVRRTIPWAVVLAVAIAIPFLTDDDRIITVSVLTFIVAGLASSWNIIGGFAGQVSLGHAGFFGIGALVTRELWLGGWPLVASLSLGIALTAVVAAVIGLPILRLRGIYFSIGTLAAAEVIRITVGNLRPGISSLPAETLRSFETTGRYFLALFAAAASVVTAVGLQRSKLGLGMMAIREDEEAAAATGVNVVGHKLVAFVVSAMLAALAGGAFAFFSSSYYPEFPFQPVWTFDALLVVFVGGLGTIVGPLVGSFFFVVVRDILASVASGLAVFQVVVFGVLFIVVVLLLPGGLVEGWRRVTGLVSTGTNTTGRSTS